MGQPQASYWVFFPSSSGFFGTFNLTFVPRIEQRQILAVPTPLSRVHYFYITLHQDPFANDE